MFADIHHHLLYGLDDGAETEEQMYQMLTAAAEDGTRYLAATPHISLGFCPFPMEKYTERLNKAQRWCIDNDNGIVLYSGAEILYSDGIVNVLQNGEIPTLGKTRSILVEFLPDISGEKLENAVRKLSNKGFLPVLAHVERYACLHRLELAEKLRELYPVKLQVNASTAACGGKGIRQKIWLKKMLYRGLVDLIASDAHSTGTRRTQMTQAYACLEKNVGAEAADHLCRITPMRILGANEETTAGKAERFGGRQ